MAISGTAISVTLWSIQLWCIEELHGQFCKSDFPSPYPAAGPPHSISMNKLLIPGSTLHWSCHFPASDGTRLSLEVCSSRSAPSSLHSTGTRLSLLPASSPLHVFGVPKHRYRGLVAAKLLPLKICSSNHTFFHLRAPPQASGFVFVFFFKFHKTYCQTSIECIKCENLKYRSEI